jgi:hypothetical protein
MWLSVAAKSISCKAFVAERLRQSFSPRRFCAHQPREVAMDGAWRAGLVLAALLFFSSERNASAASPLESELGQARDSAVHAIVESQGAEGYWRQ